MKIHFRQQERVRPFFKTVFIIRSKYICIIRTSKVSQLGLIIHCVRQHTNIQQSQPLIWESQSSAQFQQTTLDKPKCSFSFLFLPPFIKKGSQPNPQWPFQKAEEQGNIVPWLVQRAGVCKSKPSLHTLEQTLCLTSSSAAPLCLQQSICKREKEIYSLRQKESIKICRESPRRI